MHPLRINRFVGILALTFCLLLSGCVSNKTNTTTPTPASSPSTSITVTTTPAAVNPAVRAVEIDMMNNIKTNGFNPDPTINNGLGGLLINWRYGTNPLQTNVNGSGETDANSNAATRHDPLTDLRYIHNLWSFKVQNPTNHDFDSEISRYTPIIKREFANAHDERGWLYDIFIDIYRLSNDSFYQEAARSLATSYANTYKPKVGSIYKVNKDNPTGYYRVDNVLEAGCALLQASTQFHNTEWQQKGNSIIQFVYKHAYIAQYHAFPSQMGQIILPDGSANPQESFFAGQSSKGYAITGGQFRMGNVSQIVISLLDAYKATQNQDYLQKAIDLLDPLTLPYNALHMWDTKYTGYFYAVNFSGPAPVQPGDASVDSNRKEAGRQAIMLQAFHLADTLTNNKYKAMEDAMLRVALQHIYNPTIHGVPYLVNADWTAPKFRNGTLNNMVTTEAMGAELESLFSLNQ